MRTWNELTASIGKQDIVGYASADRAAVGVCVYRMRRKLFDARDTMNDALDAAVETACETIVDSNAREMPGSPLFCVSEFIMLR